MELQYLYSNKKTMSTTVMFFMVLSLLTIYILHVQEQIDFMHAMSDVSVTLFSLWNALLYIPQLIKTIREKSVSGVSVTMFWLFNTILIVYMLDMLAYRDVPLIIGYALALLTSSLVLWAILYFKRKTSKISHILIMSFFYYLCIYFIIFCLQLLPNYKFVVEVLYGTALITNAFAYAPQVLKLLKVKSAEGLSLTMFVGFDISIAASMLNGYYYHNIELVLGMVPGFLMCFSVIILILYYKKSHGEMKI